MDDRKLYLICSECRRTQQVAKQGMPICEICKPIVGVTGDERKFGSKLSDNDIIEIFNSPLRPSELAVQYGVSKSAISAIRLGKIGARLTQS